MTATSTAQSRASTPSLPSLPAFLAYLAAILLAGASTAANVTAAVSKHTEWSGMFIAGSVAVAVAILILITLPVALHAFRARQFATATIAGLMFTMAAAYSITSALGVLGAPRLTASIAADHIAKDRSRIADERARHAAELTMLAPSKSMHELSPEIARILSLPGIGGCALINGPVTRQWCPSLSALQAEHARAERRAALEGTLTRLDTEAARLGTPKIANADAAALVAVFAAFGLVLDTGMVNAGLMLLAVTILETGSGLSLAVAQSMRVAVPVASMKDITPVPVSEPVEAVASVPAVIAPAITEATVAPSGSAAQQAADKIVRLVTDAGGELRVASRRQLASMIDSTSPTVGRALALGALVVAADNAGVLIKLAA
jgi:hypothetical protein